MAAIQLDPDIAAASDGKLNQINAQQTRNTEAAEIAYLREGAPLTLREEVMLHLVAKVMTKSTSTVAATYTATAVLDGQKLRVMIDEAIKAAA